MQDRAKIHIAAGAGGDGSKSFRREAHVPRGGPDGGDGGRGGDVVLVCEESLRDLQGFRRRSRYNAGRGGYGEGSLRHGADGQTLTIGVPPGTLVVGVAGPDGEGGDLEGRSWELLVSGQRATIARGGGGGRGNKRFATATRQAPRFAERGLPGEEGWLELRLKLLADVGLVGLPNAGKSSLLARLTRATPKVASYPFTTLEPVLGVLESEPRQLVIADIPGLIEGASDGVGLGHDFLAHVERTRLLVHVLDIAPEYSGAAGSQDPVQLADAAVNHAVIEHELAAHDERLARLPRVLALSKADLVTPARAREAVAVWEGKLGPDVPVIATSSATGAGIDELAELLLRVVPEIAPGAAQEIIGGECAVAGAAAGTGEPTRPIALGAGADSGEDELAEHMVFRPTGPRRGFTVERVEPGVYTVSGEGIERMVARYEIDNEDALAYIEERLRKIGVLSALEDAGFQPGDELRIGKAVLELS